MVTKETVHFLVGPCRDGIDGISWFGRSLLGKCSTGVTNSPFEESELVSLAHLFLASRRDCSNWNLEFFIAVGIRLDVVLDGRLLEGSEHQLYLIFNDLLEERFQFLLNEIGKKGGPFGFNVWAVGVVRHLGGDSTNGLVIQ